MSTTERDSGAGAYSKADGCGPWSESVHRHVVGTGVAAGGQLLPLHQQVVEQEEAPKRNQSGSASPSPAVSLTRTRNLMASLVVRMPPAGFTPTCMPVLRRGSRGRPPASAG